VPVGSEKSITPWTTRSGVIGCWRCVDIGGLMTARAGGGTGKVTSGEGDLCDSRSAARGSQAAEYSLMRPAMSSRRRMAVIVAGRDGGGAA
jgi:hypothetical protein